MVGALLLTECSTSNNNEKKEAYYPKIIQKEEITNSQEYKDLKEKIHNFKESEEVKGKVKSGVWNDPYSGDQFRNIKELNIDHIFSLKRANNSGAYSWSTEKKNSLLTIQKTY